MCGDCASIKSAVLSESLRLSQRLLSDLIPHVSNRDFCDSARSTYGGLTRNWALKSSRYFRTGTRGSPSLQKSTVQSNCGKKASSSNHHGYSVTRWTDESTIPFSHALGRALCKRDEE